MITSLYSPILVLYCLCVKARDIGHIYVQYLLHMYNSAMPYIKAWVAIYQVENRFIKHFSYCYACSAHFPQSLKSYEHLHFSDPVVEISDRHVENMIFLGKNNTAIHDPHINGMGSSIAIIVLTIMWKITT